MMKPSKAPHNEVLIDIPDLRVAKKEDPNGSHIPPCSSVSSMSSFMSALLEEKRAEACDVNSQWQKIELISDTARTGHCHRSVMSIVKLKKSRSTEKKLSRWESEGNSNKKSEGNGARNHLDQGASDFYLQNSSPKRNRAPINKIMRASASDTLLLKMPTRMTSPRIAKPKTSDTMARVNATWDNSNLANDPSSSNTFGLLVEDDFAPTMPSLSSDIGRSHTSTPGLLSDHARSTKVSSRRGKPRQLAKPVSSLSGICLSSTSLNNLSSSKSSSKSSPSLKSKASKYGLDLS